MIKLSDKTISELVEMEITLHPHDLTHEERLGLNMMYSTNLKREQEKGGKRGPVKVAKDTAVGYMAEIALQKAVASYKQYAPITFNAEGLTYEQRKVDGLIDDHKIEVKTFSEKYIDNCYLSYNQKKSILQSVPFNEFIILMGAAEREEFQWEYRPAYLVDIKTIARYIEETGGEYSPFYINVKRAVRDGNAINLREYAYEA